MMDRVINAKIDTTFLGIEDHGIPTFNLGMDMGGTHQGFGGWDLRYYGHQMIFKILKTVGVESWEKLRGTPCRVRRENGLLKAIGHYIKDEWYVPEDEKPEEPTDAS